MIMRFFFFFFFIKTYGVGTHLNYIDAIQMSSHNIWLQKEVDKKVHWLYSEDYRIAWLCAFRGMCSN